MQEADKEIDFLHTVIHDNIGILQTLGNDVAFHFLWLHCCDILNFICVDCFETDLSEVSHPKEFEVLWLHSL
jgi:hypothetical protein